MPVGPSGAHPFLPLRGRARASSSAIALSTSVQRRADAKTRCCTSTRAAPILRRPAHPPGGDLLAR
eukprot:9501880-Pyramimonas_sp.AAC.1